MSISEKNGFIFSNPPYGVRIGEDKEIECLYTDMKKLFSKLDNFSYYLITTDEEIGSTVLLTDIKIKSSGRFLRTVNGKEDIELSYLPFIIGKQERVCDYVLDTDGVSRMHLKFFEKDNEIYARDLNSRNGTYINGRKLENEENIRLYNGDSVNICGISYILEI